MPKKVTHTFDIEYLQIMDENGNVDTELMPNIPDADLKKFYEQMHTIRAFDKKCLALQRQGKLGTYAMVHGQEASQVGTASLLHKEDWMFPSYRESGAMIVRGMPLATLLQYWAGDERGQHIPEGENDFTVAIPIASQIPHAVGAAWAFKYKGTKQASMVYFGDGSTSKGDFHEAMNFAAVFQLPVIFICQNNQSAISLSRNKQTMSATIAQKGIAYNVPSIQVDGNDIFAVLSATAEALERARAGNGPTFIECVTYRISDHTTSDDASRYRSKEEVEEWTKKDPIDRLKKYMESKGIWNQEYQNTVEANASKKVEDAVKQMESVTPQTVDDLFSYVFAEMPPQLKEQLAYLKLFLELRRH